MMVHALSLPVSAAKTPLALAMADQLAARAHARLAAAGDALRDEGSSSGPLSARRARAKQRGVDPVWSKKYATRSEYEAALEAELSKLPSLGVTGQNKTIVNDCVVFSNSDLIVKEMAKRFAARIDVPRAVFVFCNHGGRAADKLLAPNGPRPARVDWVINYNPYQDHLNGCPGKGPQPTQPLRDYGRSWTPPLPVAFWVMVYNQNMTAQISRLASACLGDNNFRLLDVKLVWTYAVAAASHSSALLSHKPPSQYRKHPSAGAIAALHERLSLPRGVHIHAIGFDGHCSKLKVVRTGASFRMVQDSHCSKFHDFAAERALMRPLGIRMGPDPRIPDASEGH